MASYQAKDFSSITGLDGISEQLIKNHFTLYQGYVTNTNKLLDTLESMVKEGKTAAPEYAELNRRFGFEFDGMRLHEYYFMNLGGKGSLSKSGALGKKIAENFSSYELWEADFKGIGKMRGVGWAILYLDTQADKMFNTWINEHQVGHPAGCQPILVMDVWEHAYMLDFQLNRAGYIDAFFRNINWDAVEKRLQMEARLAMVGRM